MPDSAALGVPQERALAARERADGLRAVKTFAREGIKTNVTLNFSPLQALLAAETSTITIFGKSWPLHVTDALGISLAKNLDLIGESIDYLRSKGRQVF